MEKLNGATGFDEQKLREIIRDELKGTNKRAREEEGEAGPSGTATKKKKKDVVDRIARWEDLPDGVWAKILREHLPQRDAFAFASTCKQFRRLQVASGVELVTRDEEVYSEVSKVSEGWCLWHSGTLRESDEEETGVILQTAAYHGYLDVLRHWRVRSQSERLWTEDVCDWAAIGGQLEALKLLRSQDPPCPWSTQIMMDAADHGQLEVLRWLRSEGCPWRKRSCREEAEKRGHTHVVSRIDEQTD